MKSVFDKAHEVFVRQREKARRERLCALQQQVQQEAARKPLLNAVSAALLKPRKLRRKGMKMLKKAGKTPGKEATPLIIAEAAESCLLLVPSPSGKEVLAQQRAGVKKAAREYKRLVWKLTKRIDLSGLPNIEKRKFREYDLDHIISIWEGFRRGIDAEAIASITNLRIIPHVDNAIKGRRSSLNSNPLAGLLIAQGSLLKPSGHKYKHEKFK